MWQGGQLTEPGWELRCHHPSQGTDQLQGLRTSIQKVVKVIFLPAICVMLQLLCSIQEPRWRSSTQTSPKKGTENDWRTCPCSWWLNKKHSTACKSYSRALLAGSSTTRGKHVGSALSPGPVQMPGPLRLDMDASSAYGMLWQAYSQASECCTQGLGISFHLSCLYIMCKTWNSQRLNSSDSELTNTLLVRFFKELDILWFLFCFKICMES